MADYSMTDEDTSLILELLQNDVEEMLQNQKGKQRAGEETGMSADLKAVQSELQQQLMLLRDRRLAQSIATAVRDDGDAVARAMREEAIAARDRQLVLRLAGSDEREIQQNGYSAEFDNGESSRDTVRSSYHPTSRVECEVCTERKFSFDTTRAPCGHVNCKDCIVQLFTNSLVDESLFPPRCCRQPIPLLQVRDFLSSAQIAAFEEKSIEINDSSRTYCSRATCSKYIPPTSVRMNVGICSSCNTRTCVLCKKQAHSGECPDGTEEVLELARERGWQRCFRCRSVVELTVGCNHIM